MKLLAVSDEVVDRLYTLATKGHFKDVDFIVGCGDLPYEYLEYLLTVICVPLFYVPGNHDPEHHEGKERARAEGGVNIDLSVTTHNNILLAGFGGCHRYRPDGINQYSQSEAFRRVYRMIPKLVLNHRKYGRALDILVTHSPPYGIHDEMTQAHQGLKVLNWLIEWAKPRYHLHGHIHLYRRNLLPSDSMLGETNIINVYPYKVIELPDDFSAIST
ncbi:MAG: metallophosphoesterase [Anaerolineales bacterium]|nr:metallophosphoesterase [Anaerolineales bacterium]